MATYRGRNVQVLFNAVDISGDGRSVSIEGTSDTLDTSAYGDTARTKIAGMTDGSASFEGLDTTGDWSGAWNELVPGALATLLIRPEGPGGTLRQISAQALVTSRSLSMPYDDLATISVSFEITGAVTETNTQP